MDTAAPGTVAINDGQAFQRDIDAGCNPKHPHDIPTADGDGHCAADDQVFSNAQRARHPDRAAAQAGVKGDRAAVTGVVNRLTQRAGAAVVDVGYNDAAAKHRRHGFDSGCLHRQYERIGPARNVAAPIGKNRAGAGRRRERDDCAISIGLGAIGTAVDSGWGARHRAAAGCGYIELNRVVGLDDSHAGTAHHSCMGGIGESDVKDFVWLRGRVALDRHRDGSSDLASGKVECAAGAGVILRLNRGAIGCGPLDAAGTIGSKAGERKAESRRPAITFGQRDVIDGDIIVGFDGADITDGRAIAVAILRAGDAALVGGGAGGVIPGVEGRAAGQERQIGGAAHQRS